MATYLSLTSLEYLQRVHETQSWFSIPVDIADETADSVRDLIASGRYAGWMGGVSVADGGIDTMLNEAGLERLWEEIGSADHWSKTQVERSARRVDDQIYLIGVGAESNVFTLMTIQEE